MAAYAASSAASAKSPFAMRLSSVGLSHMRGLQDPHAELVEIDTACASGHWHEAVVGHAGDRVDFEEIRRARLVEHAVHAAPAPAADEVESAQHERLDRPLLRFRQPRRTVVARVVCEILGLVVVEDARG